MAENLDKWSSNGGPISKIRPSDGCGRDAVLLAVERWYDFPEFQAICEMSDYCLCIRSPLGRCKNGAAYV